MQNKSNNANTCETWGHFHENEKVALWKKTLDPALRRFAFKSWSPLSDSIYMYCIGQLIIVSSQYGIIFADLVKFGFFAKVSRTLLKYYFLIWPVQNKRTDIIIVFAHCLKFS